MKVYIFPIRILLSAFLVGGVLLVLANHPVSAGDNPPPPKPAPVKANYEIAIRGGDAFIVQTRAALNLLAQCAPDALEEADDSLDTIREFNLSGMEVDTGTFLASNTTSFAPGYSRQAQIFWYAGTIVHDAHHRVQAQNGIDTNWGNLTYDERQALEIDAINVQVQVLQQCLPSLPQTAQNEGQIMIKYLSEMESGASECEYCKVEQENRNW